MDDTTGARVSVHAVARGCGSGSEAHSLTVEEAAGRMPPLREQGGTARPPLPVACAGRGGPPF